MTSLTQKYSVLFFSATRFLLLYISWTSDDITVSNNKITPSICMPEIAIYETHRIIIRQFCQHDLLVNVFLCVKVSARTSFDIIWCVYLALYTKNALQFHAIVCHFLVKDTRGRRVGKKMTRSDVIPEWPHIQCYTCQNYTLL